MKTITFRNDILPMKDRLYRLALRITLSQQDAEDAVQEALIKVWKRREQWDKIENLEAWMLTIVRNIAIDMTRKNATQQTVPIDFEPSVASHDQLQESERVEIVRQLMNSLPEKQRTAMQLRDFEGKTYREIATIMDITEEQVKVNIYRARQFIKQKYIQIYNNGL